VFIFFLHALLNRKKNKIKKIKIKIKKKQDTYFKNARETRAFSIYFDEVKRIIDVQIATDCFFSLSMETCHSSLSFMLHKKYIQ